MRVLILAPSFAPAIEAGGPARSLTNLVDRLSNRYQIDVITSDRDLGSTAPFPDLSARVVDRGNARVHYVDTSDRRALLTAIRTARTGSPVDIILLNSVWNVPLAFTPALLILTRRLRARIVVLMPRGELEPGALQLEAGKKSLAMPIVRRVYERIVDACAATSASEADNIEKWNPRLPVIRVDETPDTVPFGGPSTPHKHPRLLFLGRIHPTKGLLPLLNGMARVTSPLDFTIAGPIGDPAYWTKCQRAMAELPGHVAVDYIGPVDRAHLAGTLHNHEGFVSLTAGENFGHVFAEALQAGCPVITTDKTPWTATVLEGAGWIVDDRSDPTQVATALQEFADRAPESLPASRLAARSAFDAWAARPDRNVLDMAAALIGVTPVGAGPNLN